MQLNKNLHTQINPMQINNNSYLVHLNTRKNGQKVFIRVEKGSRLEGFLISTLIAQEKLKPKSCEISKSWSIFPKRKLSTQVRTLEVLSMKS